MAIVHTLENTAHVVFDGITKVSNTVSTLLALMPTIVKSVDLLTAKVGDVLTYTILVENINLTAISNVTIKDVIPIGCHYVADSFKVNGTVKSATYNDETRELSYLFATVPSLVPQSVTFQVQVIEPA